MSRALFQETLAAIARELAPHGFVRRGSRFFRPHGSEMLRVNFEKLRDGTDEAIVIEGGAMLTNDTIARALGRRALAKYPPTGELGAALGDFTGGRKPWLSVGQAMWIVHRRPDAEVRQYVHKVNFAGRGTPTEVAEMIRTVVLERGIPEAAPYTSDEAIRDLLLAGKTFGGAGYPGRVSQLSLAILTAKYGPRDAFEKAAEAVLAEKLYARHWPVIERLRRGEFFAPGFAPGEKGVSPK